jgi:Ca-activated chloride channel homolog
VALAKTAARTTVKAMAYAADGSFLGEDALVLNAPGGRIPVEILLGPEPAAGEGRRVTVTVGGRSRLAEVVLRADDRAIARWVECPCVASVPAATMAGTKVLSADATGLDGLRGNAVQVLGTTGYQEAVRVEAVELPVTVLDGDGRLVAGLPQASFKVFEDGVEVPLDSFSSTADLPLALGILVDTSGSMLPVFAGVREAVAGFASQLLRPGDRYFLMTFSFEPKLQVEWSGDPQGLAGALGRVTPDGGTSLYDAVVRALELFRGRRGRSALAVLSDGDDTTSRTPWAAALRYAKTARVPVYTIGYGISKLEFGVRAQLEDLAGATGADVFYVAKKGGELAGVYRRIDQELRAQYLLAYRSPSTRGPDTFRKVRVEVAGRGLTARTIAGYYPVE